jgi:hypothetical protein
MTNLTDISPDARRPRGPARGRVGGRRSELERLLDLTVLGPTHPDLGTCRLFIGTTTPYGRMAKAQDSYTHRLGWKLLRGPEPRLQAQGAAADHSEAPASNRRERRFGRWQRAPGTILEEGQQERSSSRATARAGTVLAPRRHSREGHRLRSLRDQPSARLRPPVRLPSVRCADSRRQRNRPSVSQRRPFLPERRILPAPTLCEPGPSRGCHAPREHEPEPQQHRRQEPSQDALPAWTPVRPSQHASDAARRSSLPGLQPCSAATVPGTV